jgi:hypothetical protein
MRHGVGRCGWPHLGTWYEGEWENDMPHGIGKGMMIHGQHFEGHVEEGKPSGNILMQVECVVDDCPAARAPLQLQRTQRVISRDLATMLGRQAGDCASFVATFRTPNYDGSGMINGEGTLTDECNHGPSINGIFREVGHELGIVENADDDVYYAYSAAGFPGHPLYQFRPGVMPELVNMTPEQEALAVESRAALAALRRSQQLERLAIAREQRRRIATGKAKLDKFRASKNHGGGHRKSRRMRNITRRRHCK